MSSLSSSDAGCQVERHHRQLSVQTADPVLSSEVEKGDGYGGLCVSARLGRFTIIRQLGVGGMGTVFAAYDEQLDRKVALKILHNPERGSQSHRDRTLREAKALARVRHPRVVSIYDVGTTNGQLYLAMEFVDGITLRAWLSAQTRSWSEILRIFIASGEGLQAAHEAGVIHRDFKPDNVLVGKDGLPLVLDFGVARLGRQGPSDSERIGEYPPDDSHFTYQGALSGTPGYMSPEQYGDEPVGSASDQFSFCAALYEALCGYLPFSGSTLQEHALSVRGPLRPPPVEAAFPPEVIRILSRGLSINPTDRFASMAELLQGAQRGTGADPRGWSGVPAQPAAGAGSSSDLCVSAGAVCVESAWADSPRSSGSVALPRIGNFAHWLFESPHPASQSLSPPNVYSAVGGLRTDSASSIVAAYRADGSLSPDPHHRDDHLGWGNLHPGLHSCAANVLCSHHSALWNHRRLGTRGSSPRPLPHAVPTQCVQHPVGVACRIQTDQVILSRDEFVKSFPAACDFPMMDGSQQVHSFESAG